MDYYENLEVQCEKCVKVHINKVKTIKEYRQKVLGPEKVQIEAS